MILSSSITFCPSRPIRVPQTLLYGTCTVRLLLDIVGNVQRYMDEKYVLVGFLLVCERLLIPLPQYFGLQMTSLLKNKWNGVINGKFSQL